MISEEDDVEDIDLDTIRNAPDRLPEVDEVIPQDEDVAVDAADIDVWIDPLDATQVPFKVTPKTIFFLEFHCSKVWFSFS